MLWAGPQLFKSWIAQLISLTLIHWIVIYPVDSVIHFLNYWGQDLKQCMDVKEVWWHWMNHERIKELGKGGNDKKGYRMVPRKTWVLENFGPISKSQKWGEQGMIPRRWRARKPGEKRIQPRWEGGAWDTGETGVAFLREEGGARPDRMGCSGEYWVQQESGI